ncbi:hypothetical protein [Legionella jamestowniensis]|uniref:F-box domain-containing protein n=1 Tax=Legionella jamestowniensis TaxID=455 RepID=A0A0W0UHX0_9GAMM|nr:hypothetical protein [Legionella jamestowniensis]KTD07245.1 hypothetical protein Ljam_1440 [Legionella jamestowniensis]OCH98005.1 hypothetical protein A8135_01925 [Legionella jamestowniensis]SFL95746.1 hypothetical protein SAMN02746073_2776 [Legionella jamestowniensis DSM 19215]
MTRSKYPEENSKEAMKPVMQLLKQASLQDLPRELLLYLATQFLDAKDTARLSQTSKFYKANLGELARTKLAEMLDKLNAHDLSALAEDHEGLALFIVQTPHLVDKINQPLWGDASKRTQRAYSEEQYAENNCLDKTMQRYTFDIKNPLISVASKHHSVAKLLLSEDYKATELSDKTKSRIEALANFEKEGPKDSMGYE